MRRKVMDTKEAIEILRLYKYEEPCQESEAMKDIILLLQQGEAYETILNELKNDTQRTKTFRKHLAYYGELVMIEQKYLMEERK